MGKEFEKKFIQRKYTNGNKHMERSLLYSKLFYNARNVLYFKITWNDSETINRPYFVRYLTEMGLHIDWCSHIRISLKVLVYIRFPHTKCWLWCSSCLNSLARWILNLSFNLQQWNQDVALKVAKWWVLLNVQTILRSSPRSKKKKSKLVETHTNQKLSRHLQNYTAKER